MNLIPVIFKGSWWYSPHLTPTVLTGALTRPKFKTKMTEAQRLAAIRSALNLSQREMAKEIGTSQAIISQIERGELVASRNILDRLQEKYNVNLDWYLNQRGSMFGKPDTDLSTLAGDDKEEIIRLLKDQNFQLIQQLKDKERIIRLLEDTVRT